MKSVGWLSLHARATRLLLRTVHEDSEDVVQEAFARAYNALDRFKPDQSFGAWLNRIVANAAYDLSRRRRVRTTEELSEILQSPFRDPAVDDELSRRLAAALSTLAERPRAVIVLHDVEGFTHGEIGEMLDIPSGTARSDLHHARQKLRALLKDLHE
jgi:RNA polymerase sigma-70 factor (ECF subfamily)